MKEVGQMGLVVWALFLLDHSEYVVVQSLAYANPCFRM